MEKYSVFINIYFLCNHFQMVKLVFCKSEHIIFLITFIHESYVIESESYC